MTVSIQPGEPATRRSALSAGLVELANYRSGVFTAAEARSLGVSAPSLNYHVKHNALERVGHGVYRLAGYPMGENEFLLAAATALGPGAVVSHESALILYGVSDLIAREMHFTISRSRRAIAKPAGVVLHTVTTEIPQSELNVIDGLAVTSLERAIVDAARAHTDPKQIVQAVSDALGRNILSLPKLYAIMDRTHASQYTRGLVERGVEWAVSQAREAPSWIRER